MIRARDRAFTLVEILITIVVMAIVVAVAIPSLSNDDGARLIGAVNMVASDLEYAQSLALADPNDPGLLKASADGTGYWVATSSDPDAPILSQYSSEPRLVTFGVGAAAQLVGVTISVGEESDVVQFDGFGRLAAMADISVTVSNGAGDRVILVKASTGVVEIQ
jgi:prepilin-type N-terminal cleavage/methylation domain-containing protein